MILDTNAVSALLAGEPSLEDVLSRNERHHLPVIVIGEYRYGLSRSRYRTRLERVFEVLIRESYVLGVDERTTVHYAAIREDLRQAGRPIPENDIWIAALARQHDQVVVSGDEHFDAVDGMRRVAW